MYLVAVTVSLCASYFVLLELFSLFFDRRLVKPRLVAARSVLIILVLTVVGYAIAFWIPDLELGNRVLHGFVGGYVTFLICFLVTKDGQFRITKFQFFVFSLLVVIALGVLNEHVEFFLQTYVRVIFYSNPHDTWLDLLSNTVGILLSGACFVPFVNRASISQQKT